MALIIKNNIIKHSKETQSKTTILNWTDYIIYFINFYSVLLYVVSVIYQYIQEKKYIIFLIYLFLIYIDKKLIKNRNNIRSNSK